MRDDMEDKLERLFTAAREYQPDTSAVEACFETRLMARIREQRDTRIPWYTLAWRCVPAFAILAVLLAVISVSSTPAGSTDLFASISSGQEEYLNSSFMAGE